MIWFTDYNIFISVKAYIIASQERRMYKLFKKWLKVKELKTTLYPLP